MVSTLFYNLYKIISKCCLRYTKSLLYEIFPHADISNISQKKCFCCDMLAILKCHNSIIKFFKECVMKYTPDYSSRFRILKGGKISLVVSALIGSITILSASPSGGTVTSGSATIAQSGATTNITQSTNKATINWQNFSIAGNETVNFLQPNVSSITLNRVVGNERSIIDGALNANGQVWILNSNGVLFNNTARINTAGLVATTKNISDADFNAGNYNFKGESTASVINMGTIEASDSGYVALLANTVSNEGTIKAIKGTVHLTGANEATINLNGNSLVNLTVNKGVLDALVENKGAVIADGGKIFLTTNAVDELLKGVVNNSGVVEANSLDDVTGHVELFAHGGTANVSGTIEAKDGFVETSGENLKVADNTIIKAKTWLLDPTNITVGSGGVEALSGTPATTSTAGDVTVSGATINTQLNAGTSVLLDASNNITVNDDISKTAGGDATLSLKAHGNIIVNDGISISSSAGKLNTILWSDSDATNGGSIYMKNGSSITTNGGHLWMGGGAQSVTLWNGLTVGDGYAIGTSAGIDLTNGTLGIANDNYYGAGNRFHYNGITLLNSNINTSGGDFKASGKSHNAQVTTGKAYIGVFIGGDYQISTSTGDIVLDGISAVSANDNSWYNGVALGSANVAGNANSQLITTGGDITINGEVNQNFNVGHPRAISMAVWGATNKLNLKTTTGNISLTGNNKNTVSNSANRAIGNDVDGYRFTEISSSTGNINITGIGANTGGYDIGFENAIIKTDGTITFIGDTLNILSSYSTGSQISSVTNGIGSLIIKPYTTSTTIGIGGATGTLSLASSYFSTNFLDGFSGITIGSSDQTGAIAIGATAISDALTLYTQGSVTQSGAITGNQNLNLLGTNGIYTLNNTANNINTLTANTGSVTYVDSDALTLGAITATGVVNVATQTGNMTLNGTIATTETTSSAMTLNAGKNTAAGTSTGGDIIHTSGTITTGTNGRATLYSGSISGSTGLTTLIGSGSGNFRYNSDETATNYTTALGSGNYVIYREQPIITIAPDTKTITYGDLDPSFTFTSSGYENGDTNSILSGTGSFAVTSIKSTSNNHMVGTHNISYSSGFTNGLGYAIADKSSVTDEFTVSKKDLVVSGITASNKTYDALTTATLSGTATITKLGSDSVTLGGTATGTFADKNVGDAKAITITGNTISGTDASNYNLVQQAGLTANISKANATVTANSDTKTYNGQTQSVAGFTATGLVNGETTSVLDGITTTGGSGKNVGEYTLTLSGSDDNYNLTFVNGKLTITKNQEADNTQKLIDNIVASATITKMRDLEFTTPQRRMPNIEIMFFDTNVFLDMLNTNLNVNQDSTGIYGPQKNIKNMFLDMEKNTNLDVNQGSTGIYGPQKNIKNMFLDMEKNTNLDVNKGSTGMQGTRQSQKQKPSAVDMRNQGRPAHDLNVFGYSAAEMKQAGYSAAEMKQAGYSVADMTSAGYKPSDLKQAGYSVADMTRAGYKPSDLKRAGYSAADMKQAGYSVADMNKPSDDMQARLSAREMKNARYSATDLKQAGYSAADLKQEDYSAADMKRAGYSVADLKQAGYSVTDMSRAGYKPSDLKRAGYSAAEMKQAGYSVADMKRAGYSEAQIKSAGY